ncbi:MAG: 16S rRNA (guanine(966)-N(2))-methyltransferase RsmD [Eubacteriales bacterium]|nr:16S rRNA (guanine(966)-N(2))-methyltransferase RsmD [Eubacteriales bacterium]
MRIIGGTARGKALLAPEGTDTRPTADRTREALFNILMRHTPGARVLDLFAGSGALSAEALSRGAKSALCVDLSPQACAAARRNTQLKGVEGSAQVLCMDWRRALSQMHEPFDIVFLDPPYHMTEVYGEAFSALAERGLLHEESVVVMEYEQQARLPLPPRAEVFDERKYGRARVMLVRLGKEEDGR